MKRLIIVILLLGVYLCIHAKSKEPVKDVIYIDYQYSKTDFDEELMRKSIVKQVLEPYYEKHNCKKSSKKNPADLVIIVDTQNFSKHTVGYSESVEIQGKPMANYFYVRFNYSITYQYPNGDFLERIEDSYGMFYGLLQSPLIYIPKLSEVSVRRMVPNKDVSYSELADTRRLGIMADVEPGKKIAYKFYVSADVSGFKGDYRAYVWRDCIEYFLNNIPKELTLTTQKDEADLIIDIKLLEYTEKVKSKKLEVISAFQADFSIPSYWIYSDPEKKLSIKTIAVGYEALPIEQDNVINIFGWENRVDYLSLAEMGRKNRIDRSPKSPNLNVFQWAGCLELNYIHDQKSSDLVMPVSSMTESQAFEQITQLAQEYLNDDFLAPRPPIDITAMVPPKVVMETLPPYPELVKDQFETTQQFELRMAKAVADRQAKVDALAAKYERETLARNDVLKRLKEIHESDLACIENEQDIKQQNLAYVYAEIMHKAFSAVMGPVKIRDLLYDADNQTMHGYFYSPLTGYSVGFKQMMGSDLARKYYQGQKSILPILSYKVLFDVADNSISNQQLQLVEMKTLFDGQYHPAELSQEVYQPPVVSFRIEEKQQYVAELPQLDLTPQNPVLQDRIKVESLRVRDKNLNANDDLADLIARLPQAPVDEKKWLFAVGIENYRETEPVYCSLNSTESFVQTAIKALGIKDSHVEILKDQDATTTLINARLKRLLERVKAGDTIYFYFAGHGIPSNDPEKADSRKSPEYETYLLPFDGVPVYIAGEPEMKITSIFKQLTDSRADKVICFIDACFSGQSEYGTLLPKGEFAASTLVPREPSYDKTKMVLLSATDKGQTARSYKEKEHRLFSYFLIKSLLQLENSNPSARELFDTFAENVSSQSREYKDNFSQDPQISGNQSMLIK